MFLSLESIKNLTKLLRRQTVYNGYHRVDQLTLQPILYAPAIIALQWFKLNETWIRTQWIQDLEKKDSP